MGLSTGANGKSPPGIGGARIDPGCLEKNPQPFLQAKGSPKLGEEKLAKLGTFFATQNFFRGEMLPRLSSQEQPRGIHPAALSPIGNASDFYRVWEPPYQL